MNRILGSALAAALMSTAAVARAEDKPPPSPPSASLYVGPCVSAALNGTKGPEDKGEVGIFGLLAASIVPKLIGAGLDWIGNKLAALGAEKRTTVFGVRTYEGPIDARTCIQLVRWKAGGPTLIELLSAPPYDSWPDYDDSPRMPANLGLDFFVELWIRESEGHDAVSLTPTLLYYPRQLAPRNLTRDTAIILSHNAEPIGGTAGPISWPLPRQTPVAGLQSFLSPGMAGNRPVRRRMGELISICRTQCQLASPWIANPWAAKKPAGAAETAPTVRVPGGGGASAIRPTNFRLEVTEIRDGSKFFKALADGFNVAKPAVQSNLEGLILSQTRANAEAQAQTASATALVAYSTKLNEAETSREKYCAAKGKSAGVVRGAAAELSGKQTLANVAAAAAELDPPFPRPVGVSGTVDSSFCP
ncbi:MAG: hypothetical protein K0R83_2891 [Caulobacter sp.]|jgi:hypothetical protein|nr:hypothetical protein [Caulobacter sp.]